MQRMQRLEPVKCTWPVKVGYSRKPCSNPVEPELIAIGEKVCQEHQEAKRRQKERIAGLRGEAPQQIQPSMISMDRGGSHESMDAN